MINDFAAADDQGMRSPIAEAFEALRDGLQFFAQFPVISWTRLVIETGSLKSDQGATPPQGKTTCVHPLHCFPTLSRLHQFFDS